MMDREFMDDGDDDMMSDEAMEMISYSFDDFVTDMLEANQGEFNVLDMSVIILSRLCRYSIEAGYPEHFQEVLNVASNSLDKYDAQDLLGSRTLQ
jgi:hypothetical protein